MTLLYCCLFCFSAVSIASGSCSSYLSCPDTSWVQYRWASGGQGTHGNHRAGPAAAGSSRLYPYQEQDLSGDSLLLPISSLRLLPDNCSQWLTSAGLLWHGGDQLWRRGRLDKSGLCRHVTVWCHLPSGTDTANSYWEKLLWQWASLDVKALSSLLMVSATLVCVDG